MPTHGERTPLASTVAPTGERCSPGNTPADGHGSTDHTIKGFGHLVELEQVLIEQKIDPKQVMKGVDTPNKYHVKTKLGVKVFKATERSTPFQRNHMGPSRSFEMKLTDSFDKEDVAVFKRPFGCSCCMCFCCPQRLHGKLRNGAPLGSVEQKFSLFRPCFIVKCESGVPQFRIQGPVFMWRCFGLDVKFEIFSIPTAEKVGKIVRRRISDLLDEASANDSDTFGVTFPKDLDVKMKAMLIGAVLLLDYAYFESRPKKPKRKKSHSDAQQSKEGESHH